MQYMHQSIYHAILTFAKKFHTVELFEHIANLTQDLFNPILEDPDFRTEELQKAVLLYIAYAYSKESEVKVMGVSSLTEKKAIAKMVGIPDYLYGSVVNLDNYTLRSVIVQYLEFQKDRDFRDMEMKKMLYDALSKISVFDMKDAQGKTDGKFILQNSQHQSQLLEDIETLENKLKGKWGWVEPNKTEIKLISDNARKGGTGGVKPEQSKEILRNNK